MKTKQMAKALGWFSIGLGVTELVLGGRLTKRFGMGDRGAGQVARVMGVREIATGVLILAKPELAAALWARVAGDAVDLSGLWSGMALPSNPHRGRVAAAMGAVAGVTALDIMTARRLSAA